VARRLCQTLFTLILLYAAAIAAFGFFHYDAANRPSTGTVISEFHSTVGGYVAGVFKSKPPETARVPASDAVPPPKPEESPPPAPPPPSPAADSEEDDAAPVGREAILRRVRDVLIPKAQQELSTVTKAGSGQLDAKGRVLGILVQARDLLNEILDEDPEDREANRLFQRVTEMRMAIEKR
jgi:hypothetical protein